jgi:hypothetical protein
VQTTSSDATRAIFFRSLLILHPLNLTSRVLNITMRLINVKTLKLEKFLDNSVPSYAILSHTWKDDKELTFRDIEEGRTDKPGIGSIKLQRSCKQAKQDGLGIFGSIRVASIRPTLLSLARLSTLCSDGIRRRIFAMPIC